MKAYNINCPNCGGNINLEKDVQRCFCPYCGSKVLIDDGVQRSEISYRDEAKILELQLQEQARLRAVEAERQRRIAEEKEEKKQRLKFPVALLVFCIACLITGLFLGTNDVVIFVPLILSLVVPFFYPYDYNNKFGKASLMYFGLFLLFLFIGMLISILTSAFLAPVLHLRSIKG